MVRTMSPAGGSTLITSAPKSASNRPQKGPATVVVNSSTRQPASGWPDFPLSILLPIRNPVVPFFIEAPTKPEYRISKNMVN